MDSFSLEKFKKLCSMIKQSVPGPNTWRWDEEFNVARIVFNKKGSDGLLPALEATFDNQWDFTTIDKSKITMDKFIEALFGIIPGQKVFTSHTDEGLALFAAWWPWGNGIYVSLRVGIYFSEKFSNSKEDVKKEMAMWFNI